MNLSVLFAVLSVALCCENIVPADSDFSSFKALVDSAPSQVFEYMRCYSHKEMQWCEQTKSVPSDLNQAWEALLLKSWKPQYGEVTLSFYACVRIEDRFFGSLRENWVNLGDPAATVQNFDFKAMRDQLLLLVRLSAIVLNFHLVDQIICELHPTSFVSDKSHLNLRLMTGLNVVRVGDNCLPAAGRWGFPSPQFHHKKSETDPQMSKKTDIYLLAKVFIYFLRREKSEEFFAVITDNEVNNHKSFRAMLEKMKTEYSKTQTDDVKFLLHKLVDLIDQMIKLHPDKRPEIKIVSITLVVIFYFFDLCAKSDVIDLKNKFDKAMNWVMKIELHSTNINAILETLPVLEKINHQYYI